MRDSKTLFLMIAALLLATVSFILISIWGYHFYFQKKHDVTVPASTVKKISEATTKFHRDSSQDSKAADSLIFNKQLKDQPLDGLDTLNRTLELKLMEYKKIQEEIAEIQKSKTALKNKVDEAKKINEVQKNIDSLNKKKEEMIRENEKMNQMLTQKQKIQSNIKIEVSKGTKNIHTPSLPLLVAHLKFDAINTSGSYEKQTVLASQATKLSGSFEININSKKNISSEIFIKILQPNGRPILNASSGFAILETYSGKSAYSLVLHFDRNKDNDKRLHFSINPDVFHKGKYTMQIYHNGVLIGRMQRTLM